MSLLVLGVGSTKGGGTTGRLFPSSFGTRAVVWQSALDPRRSARLLTTMVLNGTTYAAPVRLGRNAAQFATNTPTLLAP